MGGPGVVTKSPFTFPEIRHLQFWMTWVFICYQTEGEGSQNPCLYRLNVHRPINYILILFRYTLWNKLPIDMKQLPNLDIFSWKEQAVFFSPSEKYFFLIIIFRQRIGGPLRTVDQIKKKFDNVKQQGKDNYLWNNRYFH
jgi:hypothetical protein